jgi:hypothetical protein
MKYLMLKLRIAANIAKECERYTGFKPNAIDIKQKLYHQSRLGIAVDKDLHRVMNSVKQYCKQVYPYYRQLIINIEIDKIKNNPSKPLPLP